MKEDGGNAEHDSQDEGVTIPNCCCQCGESHGSEEHRQGQCHQSVGKEDRPRQHQEKGHEEELEANGHRRVKHPVDGRAHGDLLDLGHGLSITSFSRLERGRETVQ
jgi:hypothetical protein